MENIEPVFEKKDENHFPTKDKLHTDILKEKYGQIHSDVLRHDDVENVDRGADRIREARLVDENNILRTYALTFLTYDKGNKELVSIDGEIRAGGLIGETFRKHGFVVKKNVIDVFLIEIPPWMREDFKVSENEAKARFTEFYAKKDDSTPVIYGTVLEIYSPDFKDPKDGINEVDIDQVNPLTGALQSVGIPVDEIWGRLDRASEKDEWNDLSDKYEQARLMSKSVIDSLHEKVSGYLKNK